MKCVEAIAVATALRAEEAHKKGQDRFNGFALLSFFYGHAFWCGLAATR